MGFARKLERLARLVPGVAGYQDKEASRDTDKTIRLKLGDELERVKRELAQDKRWFMERKDLNPLPELDRAASKLDKLENLIKYASRGYRGLFDLHPPDLKVLDQLYQFDLGMLDELEIVKSAGRRVHGAHEDSSAMKGAVDDMHDALDRIEKIFSQRQDILTSE